MINDADINGVRLSFETSKTVFSPHGIDKGTRALLTAAVLLPDDKVLDLGCGYGAVGIYAAKRLGESRVVMSDIDPECTALSAVNARINQVGGVSIILSDGFTHIQDRDFTVILSNPPYHADFSVPKRFIEKGFNRLKIGGKMMMVAKRRKWYQNKLSAVFGGVRVSEIDGYFVFTAEKRKNAYAGK